MHDPFRSLAVYQAKVHRRFLDTWKQTIPVDRFDAVAEAVAYDALWLTKFPLLIVPKFDVRALDAVLKAWQAGDRGTELAARLAGFVGPVDADVVRLVLGLKPGQLDEPVELFFGGRAMNKPLSVYLTAWFERAAVLRAAWGQSTSMFDIVFE